MKEKIAEHVWGAGNKIFTVGGLAIGAAIEGAEKYYVASGGNVSNWQSYAIAGGAAAVAGIGAYLKKK